ncbi:MAG: 4a-hydroxytetrahydrobiopterin dehydratase [Acidobacteriaceae bacterium]|nr:4a-hydroxytetrahydrobiopterin dehydratase [Acidobacteriaceae bacterium]
MSEKLTSLEVEKELGTTTGWALDNGKLTKEWLFPDFRAAMEFVNGVAAEAKAAAHHPEIAIRYNKVMLSLVTHDSGGVTGADFALARTLNQKFGR